MKVFIVLATILGLTLCDKPLGGYGAPPLASYAVGAPPLDTYEAIPAVAASEAVAATSEAVDGASETIVASGEAAVAAGEGAVADGDAAVTEGETEGDFPIPGVPGEDYPIFNEIPETSFSCEGKVEGGYYADSEAECQAFHICGADGEGSLLKMSFLCHNGTIFNQEIFTCDFWANFNCVDAEGLYSKNEELSAAREEASAALAAAAAESAIADASSPADAPVEASLIDVLTGAAPADAASAPLPSYVV